MGNENNNESGEVLDKEAILESALEGIDDDGDENGGDDSADDDSYDDSGQDDDAGDDQDDDDDGSEAGKRNVPYERFKKEREGRKKAEALSAKFKKAGFTDENFDQFLGNMAKIQEASGKHPFLGNALQNILSDKDVDLAEVAKAVEAAADKVVDDEAKTPAEVAAEEDRRRLAKLEQDSLIRDLSEEFRKDRKSLADDIPKKFPAVKFDKDLEDEVDRELDLQWKAYDRDRGGERPSLHKIGMEAAKREQARADRLLGGSRSDEEGKRRASLDRSSGPSGGKRLKYPSPTDPDFQQKKAEYLERQLQD